MKVVSIELIALFAAIAISSLVERVAERVGRRLDFRANRSRRVDLGFFGLAFFVSVAARGFWVRILAPTGVAMPWVLAPVHPLFRIGLAIVCIDFAMYWLHRASHQAPFWRMHRVHHSIQNLTALAGFRDSALHLFVFALPLAMIPVLLGLSTLESQIALSVGVLAQAWTHWGIQWDFGPLRAFVISPMHHAMHHSSDPRHMGSNFGGLLCLWDQVFGTYLDPREAMLDAPPVVGGESVNLRGVFGI